MNPVRIAAIAALIGTLTVGTTLAAPRLEVPETEFNFGFVPQHALATHVFWMKSTGDSTVKIVQVDPGCSCTQTPLERKKIPAGDSAWVEIMFKTQYYRQPVEKHPMIYTNDQPEGIRLTFRAVVIDRPDSTYPIIIAPYKLDVSQISATPVTGADFTITNRADQPLDIKLISPASRRFELTLPTKVTAGGEAVGRLSLKDAALGESFEESFTIELNDAKHTRFTIPVRRTVHATAAESSTAGSTR